MPVLVGGVAALITGLSLCPCISGGGGGGCINYWTISLCLYWWEGWLH